MPSLANQSGYCFMRFDVDADGHTNNIEAYKCSDIMFAASAVGSVREWVYSPKLENGVAVISEGIETKVTFKLATESGDVIEEPKPIDENINAVLSEKQKAKLASHVPPRVQKLSKRKTANYCCVQFDISQMGRVFNEDVVTCSDFELLEGATKFIRRLTFTPAHYNGENISSGGYTMLIKYFDLSKNNDVPLRYMMPVIGSKKEKSETCQF